MSIFRLSRNFYNYREHVIPVPGKARSVNKKSITIIEIACIVNTVEWIVKDDVEF